MRLIDADEIKVNETIGGANEFAECIREAVQATIDNAHTTNAIPMSVIEDIKAEIKQIVVSGQVDEHISFIRTGEQVKTMVLDIIDKHCGKENTNESKN